METWYQTYNRQTGPKKARVSIATAGCHHWGPAATRQASGDAGTHTYTQIRTRSQII
jgi:hypothetical protein